jgi:hypothetical protein
MVPIYPNIRITATPNTADPNCFAKGTSSTQEVIVYNTGNFDVYDVPLVVEIHDNTTGFLYGLQDTLLGLLRVGDYRPYVLKKTYAVPTTKYGNYVVVAKAELDCDVDLSDNSNSIIECVNLDDIQLRAILTPSGGDRDHVGEKVYIKVEVENLSLYKPYVNIEVNALISDGQTLSGILSSVVPEDVRTYEFTTAYTVPALDNYTLTVFINSMDIYPANDTLRQTRYTNNSVPDLAGKTFALGQNIPNPAKDNTRIEYNLPEDGQVIFTVYTITGQTLHLEKRDANSGKNEIEFNTVSLADGLYYYSMEYKGERLVKKMTIRK